jgi:hypothetical protein
LEDQVLIENWTEHAPSVNWQGIQLIKGKEYTFQLEYYQASHLANIFLSWIVPWTERVDLNEVLRRVKKDGTVLFVLEDAAQWAHKIDKVGSIGYQGDMKHQKAWLGGSYFVREHPFFQGLPVNQAMNWVYQIFAQYKNPNRSGLIMDGEEAVVGCVTGHEHRVATAVGIIPYGKGKIVFSTLSIVPHLDSTEGAASVAKALFCNYLAWTQGF